MVLKTEYYFRKQCLIAVCLNFGHVMIGYSIGWSSPVLGKLQAKELSPLNDVISSEEASWVASSFMYGLLIGIILASFTTNLLGRKPSMLIASMVTLFGQILLLFATNTIWIYTGRVISGIGVVEVSCVNILYIGEVASPNIRGMILASTGLFHTLGTLLVYSVGPFVSYHVVSYVFLFVNVLHLASCGYFIPESPVFLIVKGDVNAAKNILKELGRSKDIDTEIKTMVEELKKEKTENDNSEWLCFELFKKKSNRKALLVTSVLTSVNQASGILCILFHATSIFAKASSSIKPDVATIILGVIQFSGSLITPFFVDKYGRKTLLLISCASCSLFLAIMGAYFYLEILNNPLIHSIRWLPLSVLVLFLFTFSFGLNVIPNIYVGETFRPDVRIIGGHFAIGTSIIFGIISSSTYTYVVEALGNHFTFWIYSAVNLFGFIFTMFLVPETKGKSLMEIETILGH